MNYEEKYKKALERAKKLYEQGTITESLGYVFPELKDEDERIRKAIKKALQVRCGGSRIISDEPVTLEEALAWLEKQGKCKQENEKDDIVARYPCAGDPIPCDVSINRDGNMLVYAGTLPPYKD